MNSAPPFGLSLRTSLPAREGSRADRGLDRRDESLRPHRHAVTLVEHTSTITSEYTATHVALTAVARELGLARTHVGVLVALAERNRRARSDKLEHDLALDSSAVGRSLLVLYDRGLCAGSPRKRGTRTTVTLTDAGQATPIWCASTAVCRRSRR